MVSTDDHGIESTDSDSLKVLQRVLQELSKLDSLQQARVLASINAFLSFEAKSARSQSIPAVGVKNYDAAPSFSANFDISPKEFLLEKQPKTDVERIACLAYYLTHYRETPHFKTVDLSKVNTEAAQPKFSNAAYATSNAAKARFLVAATKGQKQLSAFGEQFVAALPDRDTAKAAMASGRPKKRVGKKTRKSSN